MVLSFCLSRQFPGRNLRAASVGAFLGIVFAALPLFAQTSGSITGTVLDDSGAVISGAQVSRSPTSKSQYPISNAMDATLRPTERRKDQTLRRDVFGSAGVIPIVPSLELA